MKIVSNGKTRLPSDTAAVVIVDDKDWPESSGHPEVIVAANQNDDRLDEHYRKCRHL